MNSQGWEFAPDIAQRPASRILSTYVSGTGSGRRSRMLMRRVNSSRNCSYSGVVFSSLVAIIGSLVRRRRRLLLAPALPESYPLWQTLSGVAIKQMRGRSSSPSNHLRTKPHKGGPNEASPDGGGHPGASCDLGRRVCFDRRGRGSRTGGQGGAVCLDIHAD